ncbi:MAG: hypothetical protein AAFY20_24045 [Cyanobacteria bacterium J06639_14]
MGGGDLIDRLFKTEKSPNVTAIDMSCTAVAIAHNRFRAAIADRIQQRQTTRQQRDFATADDIRDRLAAVGIASVL